MGELTPDQAADAFGWFVGAMCMVGMVALMLAAHYKGRPD